MFKVEINNLSVYAVIGVPEKERRSKQLLKITFAFNYNVSKNKNLDDIKNLKDYSAIIKFLKNYIAKSRFKTLEKLISESVIAVSKKYKLKKVKIKINKVEVAKKYASESLSVSN